MKHMYNNGSATLEKQNGMSREVGFSDLIPMQIGLYRQRFVRLFPVLNRQQSPKFQYCIQECLFSYLLQVNRQ